MRKLVSVLVFAVGCGGSTSAPPPNQTPSDPVPAEATKPVDPEQELLEQAKSMFGTLPDTMPSDANPITEEKVILGRALYYDGRLSKSGEVSCNTCHLLDAYGVDGLPVSKGHNGQLGTRNSPTVYNAALQFAQFWDGREPDVESQAKGPPLNSVEMAFESPQQVEAAIKAIPGYAPLFAAAFPDQPDPITFDNIAKAIGAFERKLVTKDAFDRYQAGDVSALTDQQKRGLKTYLEVGCATCHMGPLLGGTTYQKLGMIKPYDDPDMGRYEVTKQPTDKQVFKTSPLRNVAKTAPYYHSGKVATLQEAISLMGTHQLGRELTPEQVSDMVAFMESLTGELPTDYIKKPELPK